ncbi:MAG TPA: class I SAM-dependent methyltransferase, partial [Chroococcales cyanobacterium]
MTFKDYFSAGSPDYARYRPTYPEELFEFIAALCPVRDAAWDCATGNGQAALGLTRHFQEIIATDASSAQIAHAFQHARVKYRVAPAERSEIAAQSLDAITVAQALHWFDLPRFYAEAKRTLKPHGVLVAWCYGRSSVDDDIDTVIRDLQLNVLKHYWAPEIGMVEECYRSVEFPFQEIAAPGYSMRSSWDLGEYLGYLNTWSAVQECLKKEGPEPFEIYCDRIARAWKDPQSKRLVTT